MISVEDALNDPSNDEIQPPSLKKLRLSTDATDTQLASLAMAQSSNDRIYIADGDAMKNLEEGNSPIIEVNLIEDIRQDIFNKEIGRAHV